MNAIQKRKQQHIVKPQELQKWILIGKVKLKTQILAIKAIKDIEVGMAAKEREIKTSKGFLLSNKKAQKYAAKVYKIKNGEFV